MNTSLTDVNKLFIEILNDIIKIEEDALKKGPFNDVSSAELHTIEAIGMYSAKAMSDVANSLDITVGTLTVSVKNLVNKGYVERVRSEIDRRVVKISLTKKGRLLYRSHQKFHSDMVRSAVINLTDQEAEIFKEAISKLSSFFNKKHSEIKQGELYV